MDPRLIDSSALSLLPSDITFKFTKGDGGEIKTNKTVLAMVSTVFGNMFFVHDTKDKSATELVMEDTTKPAFQIMLDAIYNGRPVQESLQGKTVDEVFAVLYLVSKYKIPQLVLDVKECLSIFPITEDNVLDVATDAMEYTSTFEETSQILLLACAKFLKTKVSGNSELFIRFVADNGDQMATVQKLAVFMKDIPPSDKCTACKRKRSECLDGQEVTDMNVEVGVKVMRKSSYEVGVVLKKDDSYNNYWFIDWEDVNVHVKRRILCGGNYLFKCR